MSYLFCPECQNKYKTLELCPECKVPLQPPTAPSQQQHFEGNGNQGIQVGRDNNGNIIINPPPSQEGPITLIQREIIKPLTVAGSQIKNWWIFIIGALAIAADLITVAGTWKNLPTLTPAQSSYGHLSIYLTFIGVLLFITAMILQQGRYMTLPFGRTVERSKEGDLYLTRIGGTCGLCGAPVQVKTVGPKEHRQTRVRCTNNPDQHWWVFDRTVLGDVGEDYRNRQ